MKNLIIIIVAILALAGVGWYVFTLENSTDSVSEEESSVIAVINGEDVTRSDLNALQAQVAAEQGFDVSTLSEAEQAQFTEQMIDTLISQILLRQATEKAGIVVTEADIEAQWQMIRGQFPDEEAFNEALAASGVTAEELRLRIGNDLAVETYLEQELSLSEIEASEAEIDEAYEQFAGQQELPPLDEMRDEMAGFVVQQKQQELVATFVSQLRDEATVEILI
ncbi:MAG: SurA N-terminal domain-containing protein [Candidatus Paceibacterota bacterium]